MDLPGGVILQGNYDELVLTRSREPDCPYPELDGQYSIPLPTECDIETVVSAGPWQVTMQIGTARDEHHEAEVWGRDEWTASLDLRALEAGAASGFIVRSWQPGDRIQPLGMRGQKKLQDLFTDLRVPRLWRGRVPLLESKKGIVWVVGHRIADWAKVTTDADERILRVRFSLGHD